MFKQQIVISCVSCRSMRIHVSSLISVNCSKTPDTLRFRNNLLSSHVCFRGTLMSLEVTNGHQ
jgi:hypothetical protein